MQIKQERIKTSNIIALTIISAMDIAQVVPDFKYTWVTENPEEFKKILWQFGGDTNSFIEVQENVTHKTLTGRLVTCDRYVLNERFDKEWVTSGHASRESIDKASGSSLLNDIYRSKGLSA